jgi:hypothetical protein
MEVSDVVGGSNRAPRPSGRDVAGHSFGKKDPFSHHEMFEVSLGRAYGPAQGLSSGLDPRARSIWNRSTGRGKKTREGVVPFPKAAPA